jgi:hypothetical protein
LKITKFDDTMVDNFLHKCLRRIEKNNWPLKVSNEEVRKRAGFDKTSITIKRRRWRWLGHVLRMKNTRHAKLALTWTPEGKTKRNLETYSRERKKRAGICEWPDSPNGETEISQDKSRLIETFNM